MQAFHTSRVAVCSITLLLATGGCLLAQPSVAEKSRTPPPLGLNLSGVVDYSSEIVFVDAFKAARAWISQAKGKPWGQGGPLDLDDQGNVKSLRESQYAETVVWTGFDKRFPGGNFTCLYEGDGDLDFTSDARVVQRKPGRLAVEVKPKDGQVFARLTRTDPKNPVRNIRFILPGFEKSYVEKPFHPDFLSRWKGFRVFRFMDWMRTNGSTVAEWSDRPTPDMHSQALRGVALEYMIHLCNSQGVEPWFCMPHRVSDDYVRQFAGMVKEKLEPSLKVSVEYSNECWNGQFEQARYCREQGQKLGLSKNEYEAQLRYFSQRSVEIFKIWEEVFGGKERLVRVLAAQSANPWTGTTVMDWKDASKQAEAISIAPYFGHRWGDPKKVEQTLALSVDDLIREMADDVVGSKKNISTYAAEARKRGLRLMAYEGGQHLAGYGGAENNDRLTHLFQAANRHPGMKDLYRQHLRDWGEADGDVFCVFSSMSRYSKWGSWGILEHTGPDTAQAPKYQAIQEYLKRSSRKP